VVLVADGAGVERHHLAGQIREPALQTPLAPLHRRRQVGADRCAARIEAQQRLQPGAVMGERKPAGTRSGCRHKRVKGREGEVRHVHGAEQQALLGMVLHQPVQGQQGPFPGRWLGQGGERAVSHLGLLPARPQLLPQPLGQGQVLRVAAQQRDRAVQVGQPPQGALQPGAALGVGQPGPYRAPCAGFCRR
jgi:hypothetical protein